jgi:hypothetical protein
MVGSINGGEEQVSGDLYSDYMRREPHPRNAVFIRKWHGKLLGIAIKNRQSQPQSILEIGPGHGYLADHCRSLGIRYEFCDTSPAVVASMESQGFKGYLGLVDQVAAQLGKYDMVWMSHVLEHSPTWLDARKMIETARNLLNDEGQAVIVSPDIMNWRREFWNVDWSHGYPTSIRNVSQMCSDVGLTRIIAQHHRNGSTQLLTRALFAVIALTPHRLIDRILSPTRYKVGDGFTYSWKCVFGWRQILIQASQ